MLKLLIGAACVVIVAAGGVAARDRYMEWSCLQGARTYGVDIMVDTKSQAAFRANDACEKAGWIEPDAWKRF